MASNTVSAVLFAKDLQRVAAFYREVLGARTLDSSVAHETLDCHGFHLMLHQIPFELAVSIDISSPPERRERTAVRLDFTVNDIARARQAARRLGGLVDDQPPPWAADSAHIHLGYDPEGNVIGLKSADEAAGK